MVVTATAEVGTAPLRVLVGLKTGTPEDETVRGAGVVFTPRPVFVTETFGVEWTTNDRFQQHDHDPDEE